MLRTARRRLSIVLMLIATAPCAAQPASPNPAPVDQAIEDLSVLSMSLREIEPGLGQPNDFARVYRVEGGNELYRQQGGLYAVFPESRYTVTKKGQIVPVVPPNTVFYIGRPAMLDPPPPASKPAPARRVEGRIDARVAAGRSGDGRRLKAATSRDQPLHLGERMVAWLGPGRLPDIVSDEEYRSRRLHELLRYAARGRSSSSK